MSVPTIFPPLRYSGSGTTGPFSVPYQFVADSNLRVRKTSALGVVTTLTLSSDYTVTGAGLPGGGNVTLTSALAIGETLEIDLGLLTLTQPSDWFTGGYLNMDLLELAMDRRALAEQWLQQQIGRTVRVTDGSLTELPVASARADKLLGFDATGAPVVLAKTIAGTASTNTIWKSPYDYGATPGEELSANNKPYIDALMDAATASWDPSAQAFGIMPTGMGKMWNCPGGTRAVALRQPGLVIRDFRLYVSGATAIGFDILGSQWVTFWDCHVYGDLDDEPQAGFLCGLDETLAVASRISYYNCSTLGAFSKAGRINVGSETSLEVGCRWWNASRSLTAVASAAVDHAGALDDHLGGVTSPNTTILQASQGHRSFVLHDWGTTQHIRQARVNLTVTGIAKGTTTTVTVSTGTLASSGLENGDKIYFYPINGMTQLRFNVYTVANISGDTFELDGVDSTLYDDFTSGTVHNQTGPGMLLAGPQGLRNGPAYVVTYGSPAVIVDRNQTTGGNPNNSLSATNLLLQCEVDPPSIVDIYQGSTPMSLQDWNLELLGSAHPPGDQVYSLKNAGEVLFYGGATDIQRMPSAPANGIFDDPSLVSLILHRLEVPLEAALNDPADFVTYYAEEIAYDREPRPRDYRTQGFYSRPTFHVSDGNQVAASFEASDTAASSVDDVAPLIELYRNNESSVAGQSVGGVRISANNDTTQAALAVVDIQATNPVQVEVDSTELSTAGWGNGHVVTFSDLGDGMVELVGGSYTVANINTGAGTFDLDGIDGTGFTAFDTGTVRNAVKRGFGQFSAVAEDETAYAEYGRALIQATVNGALTTVAYANQYGMFVFGDYVQTAITATTSELEDAGDPINTENKYQFKMVGNTTTGKPVFATGSGPTAAWNDATGSTAHSPS